MTVANLGTLLKIYEDLSPQAKVHLRGFLTQCTPETAKIFLTFHFDNETLAEFLGSMEEFGVRIPTFAPGPLPNHQP